MAQLGKRKTRKISQSLVVSTQAIVILGVFALWYIGTNVGFVDTFIWSSPAAVGKRLATWATDGTILNNLLVTLYEAVSAYFIGTILGVAIGFSLGLSNFWARVFRPIVAVLNAIPMLVFAPMFFLIFGLGPNSKIALAAIVVFFLVFFNSFRGVREVDETVLNNAKMLGARRRGQQLRRVLLPSTLTWILSSLEVSVGFSIIGVVIGEYLGSSEGLGYVISRAQGNLDTTGVMAGLVILSVVAAVVSLSISRLEKHLLRWKQ